MEEIKATEKLIETTSKGIGYLFEPWHKKRMARAEAYSIKQITDAISEAIENHPELPIEYNNGTMRIDASGEEFLRRIQKRELYQKMLKQTNIESTVNIAYSQLESKGSIDNTPVEHDWISSFFDFVGNVSNEQMQVIWGKLLAGEVERPGSFSVRTLDVLRKMSQHEAEVFTEVVKYLLVDPDNDPDYPYTGGFILNGNVIRKSGPKFENLLLLNDVGLIIVSNHITIGAEVPPGDTKYIWSLNHSKGISITNNEESTLIVDHLAYILSEAGKQLLPIIVNDDITTPPVNYIEDCIDDFKEGATINGDMNHRASRHKIDIGLVIA